MCMTLNTHSTDKRYTRLHSNFHAGRKEGEQTHYNVAKRASFRGALKSPIDYSGKESPHFVQPFKKRGLRIGAIKNWLFSNDATLHPIHVFFLQDKWYLSPGKAWKIRDGLTFFDRLTTQYFASQHLTTKEPSSSLSRLLAWRRRQLLLKRSSGGHKVANTGFPRLNMLT